MIAIPAGVLEVGRIRQCLVVLPGFNEFHVAAPRLDPRQVWHARGMPPVARPGGVGPGDATRLSSTPSTRTPAKRAGSSHGPLVGSGPEKVWHRA